MAAARAKALAELVAPAAALAEKLLTNEGHCLEGAKHVAALATKMLAKEQHHQELAEHAAALV